MSKKDTVDIYPLTIVKDRYTGVYSGGVYTAWNKKHYELPDDIDGNDTDCCSFWATNKNIIVGIGDTVNEAITDLKSKLK